MAKQNNDNTRKQFFGDGLFAWQYGAEGSELWNTRCYDPERYWGDFVRPVPESYVFPDWAITDFCKYDGNPVFAPDAKSWDCGHRSGGVHNGSILRHDGKYYYLYRGERPYPKVAAEQVSGDIDVTFDYICDIGIAESDDGIAFTRTGESLFRNGGDERYSFEDVCCVRHDGTYYLFCNRWDWHHPVDPAYSGVFLATSTDLQHWEKKGLVFPAAKRIHRNACVVQSPANDAVRCGGRFVMYLNDGLIAYSQDMEHWHSEENPNVWPGGEGCFALAEFSQARPDDVILFTGGHHTGHFYAIGEVLFSRNDLLRPRDVLLRPVLCAEAQYPWEHGLSPAGKPVSDWRDTVFFTGMTRMGDRLAVYYGGSEYYTCLAFSRKMW